MLSVTLKARNSGQTLDLVLTPQAYGELSLTIIGVQDGREIQLDFDDLSPADVDDLIFLLRRRRRQLKQMPHGGAL
jgi:hypothetical protein